MKLIFASLFTLAWCVLTALATPNIVVIISDDGGYADWEFMDTYLQSVNPGQAGSPVPTPHLNALRERGVLLTNGYTASVCSPSRAAIVTGSYQNRIGYEYNINNLTGATALDGLHPSTQTIFHRMKGEGYTTGAIGKWHLGARADDAGLGNRPENMAVDEFFGIWKGSRGYTVGSVTGTGTLRETIRDPFSDTVLETTAPWNTTYNYVTSAFGKGAVDFIDRHHGDPDPFFLYVAFTAPHGPIGNSPDINDPRIAALSSTRKQYASMVLTMDKEIGLIIDKIDDPAGDGTDPSNHGDSLTADTLVIFINDNGGASGNGTVNTPLRNWKGSTYEGGNRVPIIIAGPGIPANPAQPLEYAQPVHSIDILPTCLAAAGGGPLADIDGVNLIPYLDGTNSGPPHQQITIRNGSKVGVRKEDWKLVKNGSGIPFELYDLSADLPENTNLAAVHAPVVEELLRDFTAFEAGSDKPRHASLNSNANSINQNDHFRLNPVSAGGGGSPVPTGNTVIRNPGFETGTQADADPKYTFAELDDWTNNGAEDGQVGAINNDGHTGTYRGVFITGTRIPYQITDHVITGGETMLIDFWHKGKSAWDAADTIDVDLFYLDGASAVQVLTSATFNPTPDGWAQSLHLFPPLSDPAAINQALGIRFRSNGGSSEFVSIDDIFLSTGTDDGTAPETVIMNWSAGSGWIDTDTGATDTLLTLDAFAGAILEFPTTETFNYTAVNDMTRMSDLTFMLNELRFTGNFGGATNRSATLSGQELLFTDDLAGAPPAITISATHPAFSYVVGTDLVLYDSLLITGDGDARVEITGSIRDYYTPRGVHKSGSSTVLLSGVHPYAGSTTISDGAFLMNTGAQLLNSPVTIEPGGVLGGRGTVSGPVTGGGTVAPGQSTGTLTLDSDAAFGTLIIEIDGVSHDRLDVAGTLDLTVCDLSLLDLGGGFTEPVYLIASYGVLTGPFASISNLPTGYRVEYAYHDGTSSRHIALVPSTSPTPYTRWITDSNVSGPDADFAADASGDGIANGMAFFLGATDAQVPAASLLPQSSVTSSHLNVSFDRAKEAVGHAFLVEYSTNLALADWTAALNGVHGVSISIADQGATDHINVRLPAALAEGSGHLFARLTVAR